MKGKCTEPGESYTPNSGPVGTDVTNSDTLKTSLYRKGFWWQDSKKDDLLKLAGGRHHV